MLGAKHLGAAQIAACSLGEGLHVADLVALLGHPADRPKDIDRLDDPPELGLPENA